MRYPKQHPNKDGWSDWQQPSMRGYKLCCCDCGLVHEVETNVLKAGKQDKTGRFLSKKQPVANEKRSGYRIEWRMRRLNRSTAMVRRHMNPSPAFVRHDDG